ncbi:MAG: tetratricopeptide repeat protein [Alistipes sp.]|jgi:tetratricopeptide (TPR) repeat protein|nr:tetratricopeptide repeat protein [Alistipes sp.]
MKKIFFSMLAAALFAATASAQTEGVGVSPAPVDVAKLRSAIAKSDAEIANVKKNTKAATWIKRGTTFLDVDGRPVNGIYASMPEAMLKVSFGEATPATENVNGTSYSVYTYEHFKAYVRNGVVEFFIATTVVDPSALDKAYEAFAKAYEMDAKQAKKVGDGMGNIRLKSFENGGSLYSLGDYKSAAANFRRAYKASIHPSVASPDTLAIYYAGMSASYGSDYAASLEDLDKTLALGFESDGELYRYKFIDLYNLGRKEESLETLKTGLARFPVNENLIDLIMRSYAENEGDPTSLIPMVQEAISKNPQNPSLYQGLARVYDKLGQSDNAIKAIKEAVKLAPEDFLSNYLEGWIIVKKGDSMNDELNRQTFTSNAQYQQALGAVMDVFRLALAPLERAYQLNSSELATVELLKNLTFRLRDDAGMAEKYEKYNNLFNAANTQ